MNMYILETDKLNQLFVKDSYTRIKLSKKNEVVRGKQVHSLWQVHFVLPTQFVLTLVFDKVVFYGNVALSFRVLWTKKRSCRFLKKVLIFQKTCLKVKVLKMFKIPSDCHRKTCRSLKRRALFKIPSIFGSLVIQGW